MHRKINAILIPVLMAALLAAFFLLPSKDFSEIENRYLAPLPKLSVRTVADGSFMEEIKDYTSDHFPFRDFWIGINTRVGLARGKTLINGVYFADDDYLIEKYESPGNMKKIAKMWKDSTRDARLHNGGSSDFTIGSQESGEQDADNEDDDR